MLVLARGLYFVASLLLFGLCAFTWLLRARLPMILPLRDQSLRWALLLLALAAGCAWLGLAAAALLVAAGRTSASAASDTMAARPRRIASKRPRPASAAMRPKKS